uniref:Uncharacterized protein n=1 Tax=Arundo donax TaxID=35708 RepID=A0A0A9FBM4_ARUDO
MNVLLRLRGLFRSLPFGLAGRCCRAALLAFVFAVHALVCRISRQVGRLNLIGSHLVRPSPFLGVRRPFGRAVSPGRLRVRHLVVAVPVELRLALLVAVLPLVIQERLRGAVERVVHGLISWTEAGVGAHHPAAAEARRPRGALDEARVHGEMAEALREEPGHRGQETTATPRSRHNADVGERHGLGGRRPQAGRREGVHHRGLLLRRRAREGGAELALPLHRDAGAGGVIALHSLLGALVHVHRPCSHQHNTSRSCRAQKGSIEAAASREFVEGQWTNGRRESLERMHKGLHWPELRGQYDSWSKQARALVTASLWQEKERCPLQILMLSVPARRHRKKS